MPTGIPSAQRNAPREGFCEMFYPRTTHPLLLFLTLCALATAFSAEPTRAAAASSVMPTPAAKPANRFGILFSDPVNLQLGQTLGVGYQRQSIEANTPDPGEAKNITGLEAVGFGVVVTYDNICSQTEPSSCPVTNPAAYKASLGAQLDATLPSTVVIENEEDGTGFSTSTPIQYLQELTYAVQVAHQRGYLITNGGLTTLGLNLAYWHHLWLSNQWAAADQFAQSAFYSGVVRDVLILPNIPNRQNPARPILVNVPAALLKLQSAETLIAGYQATGIDYVNFHWYQAEPVDMEQSISWLEQTTGLQAVCGEMGQYYLSHDLIPGLLNEAITLGLPYVIWNAADSSGSSIGLANQDGTLRINGLAFESFVSTHE
jgi:hypothetical protein